MLRRRDGVENTIVIPPLQALPVIQVTLSDKAAPSFGRDLDSNLWALQRWNAPSVSATLCGIPRDHARKAVAAALTPDLTSMPLKATAGSWRDCRSIGGTGPSVRLTAP